MKTSFILVSFIFLFLNSILSNVQSIDLAELLKLKNFNYEDFETAVDRKGYQYLNSTTDDDNTTFEFLQKGVNGLENKYIVYIVSKNKKTVLVNYRTPLLSEYKILKGQAIKSGYTPKEAGQLNDENGSYITYKKGTLEIKFSFSTYSNEYGKPVLYYQLLII